MRGFASDPFHSSAVVPSDAFAGNAGPHAVEERASAVATRRSRGLVRGRGTVWVLTLVVGLVAAPASAATVEVTVDGIEPLSSSLYVALCQGGLTEAECRTGRDAPVSGTTQRMVFQDVAPGTYAVAAFQDENGNGRLDRTGLGLPTEPYGFSGASERAARPDFARARITIREPGLAVRVRLTRALPRR